MALDLAAAADAVVTRLTAAGIRATVDERNLNPPAVWIKPPAITYRYGKGWAAVWTLQAVVPDTGRNIAMAALGELVDAVTAAMSWAVVTAAPIALIIPGGAAPLPGYEMTFNERIN
jgi:hypothetical protein